MGIYKVRNLGLRYYVEDDSVREHGMVERPGSWIGRVAGELGIAESSVSAAALAEVAAGVDPVSGAVLDAHHDRVVNLGYDIVLAAPKSVSLLFALGDPATSVAVVRAHDAAVSAVMGYLEEHAAHVERGRRPMRVSLDAGGFVAASFLHRTSRAPDPHLHTHVVILNLAHDPAGRWSALDARTLFDSTSAASALYASHLRAELTDHVGLAFRSRLAGMVDLAGVGEPTIRAFSRRSEQIAIEAERLGSSSPIATRVIADRTRPAKDLEVTWPALVENWRRTAERSGLSTGEIARLGRPLGRTGAAEPAAVLGDGLAAIVDGFARPFSRRDLSVAIAERAVTGATVSEVERRVDEALDSPRVRTASSLGYFSGGERRVPRPRQEPRWTGPTLATALDQVRRALDSASVGITGELQPGSSLRGVLDVDSSTALRSFAADALASGRQAIALAPSSALFAHLFATTGIATGPGDGRPRPLGIVVVLGATGVAPRTLAATLERATNDGAAVVFLDRPRAGSDLGPKLSGNRPAGPFKIDAREPAVCLVDRPGELAPAIDEAIEASREHGARPVLVAADGADLASLGVDRATVSARVASDLARRDRSVVAVVLGDDRVLGTSGVRALGGRRIHLGVEPLAGLTFEMGRGRDRGRSIDRELGLGR